MSGNAATRLRVIADGFRSAEQGLGATEGRAANDLRVTVAGAGSTENVGADRLGTAEFSKVNIADCKLYSPFTGQIARVHLIPGAYALPGQPVVTVQMMDPMKVNIAYHMAVAR